MAAVCWALAESFVWTIVYNCHVSTHRRVCACVTVGSLVRSFWLGGCLPQLSLLVVTCRRHQLMSRSNVMAVLGNGTQRRTTAWNWLFISLTSLTPATSPKPNLQTCLPPPPHRQRASALSVNPVPAWLWLSEARRGRHLVQVAVLGLFWDTHRLRVSLILSELYQHAVTSLAELWWQLPWKGKNLIPYGGYITNSSRFSFRLNGAQQCSLPIKGVPGAFLGELAAQLANAGWYLGVGMWDDRKVMRIDCETDFSISVASSTNAKSHPHVVE